MNHPVQTTPASTLGETGRATLRADLAAARQVLLRATDEHAAILADPDTIQEDRDASALLLAKARGAVDRIEAALARAEAGSYGRCERCGGEIGAERLAALPDTTICIACRTR